MRKVINELISPLIINCLLYGETVFHKLDKKGTITISCSFNSRAILREFANAIRENIETFCRTGLVDICWLTRPENWPSPNQIPY